MPNGHPEKGTVINHVASNDTITPQKPFLGNTRTSTRPGTRVVPAGLTPGGGSGGGGGGSTPSNSIIVTDGASFFTATTLKFLVGSVSNPIVGEVDYQLPPGSADVIGTYPALTVVALQGVAWASGAPSDAQVPVYNTGLSQWTHVGISGDSTMTDLGAMTNVAIQGQPISVTVPNSGDVLQFLSGVWTPSPVAGSGSVVYLGTATVASITNIALTGTPTVDGVGTSAGSVILCVGQTSAIENGPWTVVGIGLAFTRPTWYSAGTRIAYGRLIFVDQGTSITGQLQTTWEMTTGGPPIVDTNATGWTKVTVSLQGGVVGVLPVPDGGTGLSTITAHGLMVGNTTGAVSTMAAGTAGQIVRSGGAGADPSYSTATYPATASTSGNVLTSDGTNWNSSPAAGGAIPTDYISGCYLVYNNTTSFTVGSGSAYSSNGAAVITVTGSFNVTPTIAASTVYYVYLTSATTATASTTAPTNYQGTAWQDGSGNRYIGSFLTDGSSHIISFLRTGNIVRYRVNIRAAPFIILNAGTAVTSTSVPCSAILPVTARRIIVNTVTGLTVGVFGTSDGVTPTSVPSGDMTTNSGTGYYSLNLNTARAFLYCITGGTGTLTIYAAGYEEDR